ncbi:NAD-dependent epimerase/dehydratase family protein [uncultured Pseudacidovorax sp.]|uniref:NAD-dependent epimerase/dehydratase family protein n=1 Tax=uncultured Pseudacidovorax sp. TaxID=679313 RepID=UPI0025D6BBB3|nr:NAD-dependent epimerase/dehydratase family protein [uncultured Pseudacidovorax sp.]
MTRILVTGAGGFVGQALVKRLLAGIDALPLTQLVAVDLALDLPAHPRLTQLHGSVADDAVRAQALAEPPDVVFHLAAITSGQAEREFELGLTVNLRATLALFEDLRRQHAATGKTPRLVQTSSIGVFGLPLPPHIDDATPIVPTMSYGAHKRMLEILLADYSRRGWIDGRSPRLPSVVARPGLPNGALSAFASDLIRELAAGRSYESPVDAEGTLWLLSLPACVEALIHAACIDGERLPATRAWTLPSLHVSVAEVVAALMRRFGVEVSQRLSYAPDPAIIPQFARWPSVDTALARSLGFVPDPSLDVLIERCLPGAA